MLLNTESDELTEDNCGLLIVDIQGKLTRQVHDSEQCITTTEKLIRCCTALSLPAIVLEQNPQGLGETIPQLKQHLHAFPLIEKYHFSGFAEPALKSELAKSKVKNWLVAGIEAHVCVYQTVIDMTAAGYQVHLVTDCVSSRRQADRDLAINNMHNAGVRLTSFEMIVFRLMKTCHHPTFKTVLNILK